MKRCNTCGELKSEEDFYRDKSKVDGRKNKCNICSQKYMNEYYHKNKDRDREKRNLWCKKYRQNTKLLVMSHYCDGDIKCQCCGETNIEFMSIDHIEGGGGKHRKSLGNDGVKFYQWLKNNNFPEGYRVLCHNCNMSMGLYNYCPHQERG